MKRPGSIFWILFLLAALFAGPAVILRQPTGVDEPTLRQSIEQEELVDAPADLKGSVPTAPSAEDDLE